MVTIHLGGEPPDLLALTVYGRVHPDASDFWDGNWVSCTAEVSAGAFRGTLGGSIRTDELVDFHRALSGLYERLDGEVVFQTMEGWIDFRVTANRRGRVEVRGRLIDDRAAGNALEFRLSFDQTFLPPIIARLREAEERFPVVGDRPVRP
jgi:hypothetical protein